MSTASRNRKKNIKKENDFIDPERKEIRNAIRNGKAPRLTRLKSKYQPGVYREVKDPVATDKDGMTLKEKQKPGKRLFVVRRGSRVKFSAGVMGA